MLPVANTQHYRDEWERGQAFIPPLHLIKDYLDSLDHMRALAPLLPTPKRTLRRRLQGWRWRMWQRVHDRLFPSCDPW